MSDALGDRMKKYEGEVSVSVPAATAYVVRVDGRSFHTYTKKFDKPFDTKITVGMNDVANALVAEISGVVLGYTQSDETSILVRPGVEHWFGGKVQKIASVSAAIATYAFNNRMRRLGVTRGPALFDARVIPMPEQELANYLIWRQRDCVRNSVQSLARNSFSHKHLHGKNTEEMLEMLAGCGISWSELPNGIKYGRRHTYKKTVYIGESKARRTRIVTENLTEKLTFIGAKSIIGIV